MVSRVASLIVRAIQIAPLVACLSASYSCSNMFGGSPTVTPTPTTRSTATRTKAPVPTDTPKPAAPEAAAPAPPTPNVEATASTARTACEGYVAVLSGKKQDKAALDDRAVQGLARQVPDLAACGAVARDSDELCMLLGPNAEQGQTKDCVLARELFHELRAYPNTHSFYMTEQEWSGCHGSPFAPICDALRQALRSGDANKCVLTADFQSICRKQLSELTESQCRAVGPAMKTAMETKCRAMVTVDKSVCHLKEADVKKFDFKGSEDFFKESEAECKRKTEDRALLGKGLRALAESGPPREREFAKAALGQTDACATYAKAAMDSCAGGTLGTPVAGTPGLGGAVPSGTSSPTGNSSGSAPGGS